ncbi:phosphate ABC transporter permease subunit PstC [Gracilimonas sp.]|uniref:phosphate ABC transporter permease subunit PstC n=1 Tax=Gracilimonas sp. TaxID=1974203 RepID=UPI003BADB7A9
MFVLNNRTGKSILLTSTLLSGGIIVVVFSVLLMQSLGAIQGAGLGLISTEWNPALGQFGILSMLYGTVMVTGIALLLAVPVGISCAILISEVLPSRFRIIVKSTLEVLAGIPSIIYGLIGVALFSVWIGNIFELSTGRTILTAGIILAIMILPIIITLTEEALQNVPSHYRESALALGLYKYEVITGTLLSLAKRDIVIAVLLGLGRALGETMAVMLVIGSIDRIPDPILNVFVPGQTITSKLGREITESAFGSLHFSSMIFMGFLLMIVVFAITILSQRYIKSGDRLHE